MEYMILVALILVFAGFILILKGIYRAIDLYKMAVVMQFSGSWSTVRNINIVVIASYFTLAVLMFVAAIKSYSMAG